MVKALKQGHLCKVMRLKLGYKQAMPKNILSVSVIKCNSLLPQIVDFPYQEW